MQSPAITSPLTPPLSAPTKPSGASIYSTEVAVTAAMDSNGTQAAEKSSTPGTNPSKKQALTDTDYRAIAELKKIDREVHAHEQAHLAAAGGLARGGASFGYTQGPDGKRYAVSGEVSIDTSPGANPEATLLKAQRIQAAALAPSQPSGADRAIASAASQMAASARAELLAERLHPEDSEWTSTDTKNSRTDSSDGNASSNTQTIGTEPRTQAPGVTSNSSADLVQRIKQATSAGDALGNILNTAV